MGMRSDYGQGGIGEVPGKLGALTAHLASYMGWPAAALKGEEIHS